MKKLNKINYLSILLLALLFIRCTDLEEETFNVIPLESYGKNTTEAASLVGTVYNDMRYYWWRWMNNVPGVFALSETSSDMAIVPTRKGGDWWDGGENKAFRLGNWVPTTNRVVMCYDAFTGAITRANRTIYMVENNEAITDKTPFLSQARFARAFWYYVMLDNWGNVPLVNDFSDLSMPSTTPRKEVYAFVMSELNDIKDLLPNKASTNYGQFTKGAAYALLAKMYLNALVWNPDGGPKWQECIDACDVIMSLNYSLELNRRNNFTAKNEACTEAILPILFHTNSGAGVGFNLGLHYLGATVAMGLNMIGANGPCAMPGYYYAYDPADKRLAWDFLTGPQINPATGQTIMTAHGRPLIYGPEVVMKYGVDADGWGQTEQEDGARINKWEYAKNVSQMENDCAIFRLADIYLMKAECLVRLGQDNEEATRLVNEIRKRAFDDPAKLKTSVTLDDIYNERRFELAWEGYTRQDMIRFGTFLDPIPGWRGALTETRLLFPIPQTAINKNPKLTQNPGY